MHKGWLTAHNCCYTTTQKKGSIRLFHFPSWPVCNTLPSIPLFGMKAERESIKRSWESREIQIQKKTPSLARKTSICRRQLAVYWIKPSRPFPKKKTHKKKRKKPLE